MHQTGNNYSAAPPWRRHVCVLIDHFCAFSRPISVPLGPETLSWMLWHNPHCLIVVCNEHWGPHVNNKTAYEEAGGSLYRRMKVT